jgi:hypothetical protein
VTLRIASTVLRTSPLRVSRDNIDAQLRSEGLVKFLKPGWRGAANVVLTTYETLRDLEFSFAAIVGQSRRKRRKSTLA